MGRVSVEAVLMALAVNAAGAGLARAGAGELAIHGVDVERTITCDGRDVVIDGTGHRLTLRGSCPYVRVMGTGHLIRVEALGRADLMGVENRLEWQRASAGSEPRIVVRGLGNRAVHVEAAPAEPGRAGDPAVPASITIEEGDLQKTFDCAGGDATVDGGENRLTLRRCRDLTVTGAENAIVLEGPVRSIRLLGNDNTVEWSEGEGGAAPRIETRGSGNRVSRR